MTTVNPGGSESGSESWNVWSKYVLAELKRAGTERKSNKDDLEKFIEQTFKNFIKDEFKPLETRVVKVERVIWAWVIFVAILVWGLQQVLSSLV